MLSEYNNKKDNYGIIRRSNASYYAKVRTMSEEGIKAFSSWVDDLLDTGENKKVVETIFERRKRLMGK